MYMQKKDVSVTFCKCSRYLLTSKSQKKMNLGKLNLVELQELVSVDEGRRIPIWKDVEKFLVVIGVMDMVDRFMEGWNSYRC